MKDNWKASTFEDTQSTPEQNLWKAVIRQVIDDVLHDANRWKHPIKRFPKSKQQRYKQEREGTPWSSLRRLCRYMATEDFQIVCENAGSHADYIKKMLQKYLDKKKYNLLITDVDVLDLDTGLTGLELIDILDYGTKPILCNEELLKLLDWGKQ